MQRFTLLTLLMLLVLLGGTACAQNNADPTSTPAPTATVTEAASTALPAAPTSDATSTVNASDTPAVTITTSPEATDESPTIQPSLSGSAGITPTTAVTPTVVSIALGGEEQPQPTFNVILIDPVTGATSFPAQPAAYDLTFMRLNTEALSEDLGSPPAGQRWAVLNAVLTNVSGAAVTVSPEQLLLVDANGTRYTPEPPSDLVQPALLNITLAQGDSVNGFALYALPLEIVPGAVLWCLDTACEDVLQVEMN
ncbi:MAG: hypothetical protein OHK0046_42350 [Anaerolineae bacterium]